VAHHLSLPVDSTGRPEFLDAIVLRPSLPEDRDVLRSIYATTRADELALTPWSDEEKAAFVEMQFDAQDRWYRQIHPDGEFLLILRGGRPIGRLYVAQLADEIRLIDIALLPEERGRGIGTGLIERVISGADAAGLPVRLHVEPWNPALRLYERLGFRVVEERGINLFMERSPTPS
jgi:ribosomal protein S18 acetylase RimI-like enzyme